MPPYVCPDPDTRNILRFIRVHNDIFVGNALGDKHKDIIRMDEISDAVETTRKTDPTQVDAGFIEFSREGGINVDQRSDALDLPVYGHSQEAREITLRCFREQSPGRKVRGAERF